MIWTKINCVVVTRRLKPYQLLTHSMQLCLSKFCYHVILRLLFQKKITRFHHLRSFLSCIWKCNEVQCKYNSRFSWNYVFELHRPNRHLYCLLSSWLKYEQYIHIYIIHIVVSCLLNFRLDNQIKIQLLRLRNMGFFVDFWVWAAVSWTHVMFTELTTRFCFRKKTWYNIVSLPLQLVASHRQGPY